MKHQREWYVPKGAIAIRDKQSDALSYLYETAGVLYGLAFHGKAQKPDWHYRFRAPAAREKQVLAHFESRRSWLAYRRKLEGERQAQREKRKLELGHVLRTCWGYEQTNVEFFQVTKLVGKSMVELREIAQYREETGWLRGKTLPAIGKFIGGPLRRVDQGGRVRICGVRSASLWSGKPAAWTAYH